MEEVYTLRHHFLYYDFRSPCLRNAQLINNMKIHHSMWTWRGESFTKEHLILGNANLGERISWLVNDNILSVNSAKKANGASK